MDCESIKKMIEGYYGAKLTTEQMVQVSKHLKKCRFCKESFTNMVHEKAPYSLGKKVLNEDINWFIGHNLKLNGI
ncbi:MAG: hypothetical protein NTU58_03950 [Candidatus Nealsonbacteria bacterium]|nr:hypothetical protein [Candidatus Nealsonbacteria bacterium]